VTAAPELGNEGPRVVVRTIRPTDVDGYRRAVLQSRARLARWNPVDPDDLMRHLTRQSDVHRTFVVLARDHEGSHGIVGRVNVTNIVRGRFQSGVLGYDAFDPYAGRGLFAEGLSLVVGLALSPHGEGLGLHRVEANVQPGNVASAGLLRSLGFRHEGRSPRMLLLGGPGDGERWRDHERYAVTAEEWPAPAYRRVEHRRLVVLVAGPAAGRRQQLAAALSTELGLPLLVGAPAAAAPSEAAASEGAATTGTVADAGTTASASGAGPQLTAAMLWCVLAGCPTGAVVTVPWGPESASEVRAGLHLAGVRETDAVQVWCTGSAAGTPSCESGDVAVTRTGAPAGGSTDHPSSWGLAHSVLVAPSTRLGPAEVTRVALLVRASRDGVTA